MTAPDEDPEATQEFDPIKDDEDRDEEDQSQRFPYPSRWAIHP